MAFEYSLIFTWIVSTMLYFACFKNVMSIHLAKRQVEYNYKARSASSFKLNAVAHLFFCLYMLIFGEGDLSFFGPFSNQNVKVVNMLAIPLTLVYYFWSVSALQPDAGKARFLVPVVFFGMGWFTVWPKFLMVDQFNWPSIVTAIWIFIYWSEAISCYYGLKVLIGR